MYRGILGHCEQWSEWNHRALAMNEALLPISVLVCLSKKDQVTSFLTQSFALLYTSLQELIESDDFSQKLKIREGVGGRAGGGGLGARQWHPQVVWIALIASTNLEAVVQNPNRILQEHLLYIGAGDGPRIHAWARAHTHNGSSCTETGRDPLPAPDSASRCGCHHSRLKPLILSISLRLAKRNMALILPGTAPTSPPPHLIRPVNSYTLAKVTKPNNLPLASVNFTDLCVTGVLGCDNWLTQLQVWSLIPV